MKRKVTLPDRVEALCFAALGAAIAYAAVGGSYTTLTTPRSLPYLIIGAVLLFVLATAAWLGLFHATERSVLRFLIALIIPALLIAVPFQPSSGSGGFDEYAGGRAIVIPRSSHKPDGSSQLHGLDTANKTLTISDDEFGSWFEQIDHNPQRYVGYHVQVTGFVSKSRTFDADEFELSRQFMSCCILDMTPFGFIASSGKAAPRTITTGSPSTPSSSRAPTAPPATSAKADTAGPVGQQSRSRPDRLLLLAVNDASPEMESTALRHDSPHIGRNPALQRKVRGGSAFIGLKTGRNPAQASLKRGISAS